LRTQRFVPYPGQTRFAGYVSDGAIPKVIDAKGNVLGDLEPGDVLASEKPDAQAN
jgi:hypothetical protein